MLGVISAERAKMLARQQGLDLIEISPNAEPPVCKIGDFGKYRYEEKRKERDARKKQHVLAMKEIKFHVNVEEHDYQTKLNSIIKFLEKGHKVKLSLFFRGRENVHQELGMQVIKRVIKDSEPAGKVELEAKLIGRSVLATLAPKGGKTAGGSHPQGTPSQPARPQQDEFRAGGINVELPQQSPPSTAQ